MKPFVFSAWRNKWLGKWQYPRPFLYDVRGVIHIGANVGQESTTYAKHDLHVVWIEPIPQVFEQLCENLKPFPKQRAYQYLLANENGREYTLHISNNGGASSSILPFAKHREMWPEITYTGEVRVSSITFGLFVEKEKVRLADYEALVLDTQGSELMILEGAIDFLSHFRFIKVEVANFESYTGCCQLSQMDEFMRKHGFRKRQREVIRSIRGIGAYYDVTYEKKRPSYELKTL
jgi:FkbM family methyltransferase